MSEDQAPADKGDPNIEKRGIGADAVQLGAGLVNLGAGAINLANALRKPGSADSEQVEPPPQIELPPGVDLDE
jgi:hypothetical protein